jgi:hypothetical protein
MLCHSISAMFPITAFLRRAACFEAFCIEAPNVALPCSSWRLALGKQWHTSTHGVTLQISASMHTLGDGLHVHTHTTPGGAVVPTCNRHSACLLINP